MYKYRIIVYSADEDGNYVSNDFFIGRPYKKYYIDYYYEDGENVAEDMKIINLVYRDTSKNALKWWWKKKLLWNTENHFKNIEDIKKKYNLIFQSGTQVIILAFALN